MLIDKIPKYTLFGITCSVQLTSVWWMVVTILGGYYFPPKDELKCWSVKNPGGLVGWRPFWAANYFLPSYSGHCAQGGRWMRSIRPKTRHSSQTNSLQCSTYDLKEVWKLIKGINWTFRKEANEMKWLKYKVSNWISACIDRWSKWSLLLWDKVNIFSSIQFTLLRNY